MGENVLKIAYFVVPNWEKGTTGVRSFIRGLVPFLREQFDCVLAEPKPVVAGVQSGARDDEVKKGSHPAACGVRLALGYVRKVWQEFRYMRRLKHDLRRRILLMNSFGCVTLPIAARMAFPFARIITIAHTHPGQQADSFHPVRRFVEELCALAASEVIFNSHAQQKGWCQRLRMQPRRCHVIHHGVPAEVAPVPTVYPAKPAGSVDFVCVARLIYWKGHSEMLSAWQAARQKRPDLRMRLIFVGDGAMRRELEQKSHDLGVDDSIFIMGEQPNGKAFFGGGDVGVLGSVEPEAFGLVLLEAMAYGVPILATRIGGIPEVVEDGVTGVLVEPGNREEMAEAMIRFAESAEMRAEMGMAGRLRLLERFSVERMDEDYRRVLLREDDKGAKGKSAKMKFAQ